MNSPVRFATLRAMIVTVGMAGAAFAQTLTIVEPSSHFVSPPLTQIRGGSAPLNGPTEIPIHPLPLQAHYRGDGAVPSSTVTDTTSSSGTQTDAVLQTSVGPLINATAGIGFTGMSVYDGGYIPSDNNIAVGPRHIVETVNAAYAIYDKSGTKLLGPSSLRSLWAGLGGSCAANNGGDPVVQYDKAADRWIITQLGSLSSPYAECIAVSTSSDPTLTYNLYSYSFGSNLNDYPKFGVWPTAHNSAYLASYNLFANGTTWAGAEICAYDRAAMLAGASNPKGLCFTGISGDSFLPADLDGSTPPLDGTPGYFVDLYTTSQLGMYKLSPDFTNSTATLSALSNLSVSSFSSASSVPQPGTTRLLDALSDRAMYRLAYRNYGDHASMVLNHSVATGGVAGVRWYEMQQTPVSTGGSFGVNQQSTFAPGDGNHRWMGSIAMDSAGDMGLGYSVSNGSSTYPSVRYTGRSPGDALGQMQTEATLKNGSGSQTGYSRWGDYSSMRIDPSDDCTFWYVNEFLPVTSSYGWYTYIGAFKFSGCGAAATPDFSLSASPSSVTITAGQTANSSITMTALNGYSDTVTLSVAAGTCPTSATCSLAPGSVLNTTPTSQLTVTGAAAGSYTITINGTAGTLSHSTTVSLTVNAAAADFTMPAPLSLAVTRGTSSSVVVNVGMVGVTTAVTLSVSGLPSRVTSTFDINPVNTPGTSKLTISVAKTGQKGIFNVRVTGTNGGITHSTPLALTIN